MKTKLIILATCWAVIGIFEPAHAGDYDIGRDENTRNGTLGEGRVQTGRIIHVRTVAIEPTRTAQATGTSIGAIAGAVLGREIDDIWPNQYAFKPRGPHCNRRDTAKSQLKEETNMT